MAAASGASRTRAFAVLACCYATALAVAVFGALPLSGRHPLWVAAAADALATVVVFGWSRAFDNSSLYDPYWSVAPPFLLAYFTSTGAIPVGAPRLWLGSAVVSAWAVRLTVNCLRRWEGFGHEDFRYVDLRQKHGRLYWGVSFLGIHLFPTVLVFLGSVPLFWVGTSSVAPSVLDFAGAAVAFFATWVEARADAELRRFVTSPREPGAILSSGLWKNSRHPNYFGEIAFWWGVWLLGLGAGAPAWSVAGAVAITLLFVFVSVPMMDARMLARRPAFAEHARRTNAILPWPPKR
ncbi:MAG TPA: DUF1295 domain-containing protein [Polyangiaceae bacterium]|nr:DUF1295 domain-containing protein [Polyangiaceae bacterium]